MGCGERGGIVQVFSLCAVGFGEPRKVEPVDIAVLFCEESGPVCRGFFPSGIDVWNNAYTAARKKLCSLRIQLLQTCAEYRHWSPRGGCALGESAEVMCGDKVS